jgi:threonine synthase
MDVGNPSNFVRILEIFHQQPGNLKKVFSSYSISDEETRLALKAVYDKKQYLMDPHGSVGYIALLDYLSEHPGNRGMFLETAHPVKFYDVVEPIINTTVPIPVSLSEVMKNEKVAVSMNADYNQLKEYLMA